MTSPEDAGQDRDREDPAPDDLDARFQQIVSGLELSLPPGPESAGSAEPGEQPVTDGEPPAKAPGPGSFEELRAWIDVHPDLLDGDGADDPDGAGPEDDEPHYEPPPPPPVPRGDRVSRWAWASAVGAPVGYVGLSLLGVDTGGLLGMALIAAFAAGFVTLVVRMKDGPRVDDGPDDGAVV